MKKKILILLFLLLPIKLWALDLNIISKIESNNNPLAYNSKDNSIGLYQITPICLKEYNNFHSKKIKSIALFNPIVNKKVAKWYIEIRIPQMLKYYGYEITDKNIIVAYNAGIKYIVEDLKLPLITKKYLEKYNLLLAKKLEQEKN